MTKFLTLLLILISTNSIAATCFISHKCGIPVINMTWGPAPGEYGEEVEVNSNEDCIKRAFDYLKEYQPNGKCVSFKGNATANYESAEMKIKTKIKLK